MIEIPLEYYTEIYYNLILLFSLIVIVHTNSFAGYESGCYVFNKTATFSIILLVVLYMGLRPISGRHFGDMLTYARHFEFAANGGQLLAEKDLGFTYFIKSSARVMNVDTFFILCTLLYILPVYFAFKRWFPNLILFAILIYFGSLSFWSYGTNGIRAGIASSFFIYGLAHRKSFGLMSVLFLISILFHKSMLLPLLAYCLTYLYNKPQSYLIVWFSSIVLSFAMGGVWELFFANLGFGDDRFASYLTGNEYGHQFSRVGFRWDFLIYSATAVGAGFYYIFKSNFKDRFYYQIFNTYLLSNAFWILVIRSSFSNRFAYLSWFLMTIVIIYPLLKKQMFRYQYSIIGLVIFTYFAISYVMFYIAEAR